MKSISQINKRYLPHELKTRIHAVETYRNGNSIDYVCIIFYTSFRMYILTYKKCRKTNKIFYRIPTFYFTIYTVTINKQITKQSCRENWRFVPPKTQKSNRVLPLVKVLLEDLKKLKESDKEMLVGFQ